MIKFTWSEQLNNNTVYFVFEINSANLLSVAVLT